MLFRSGQTDLAQALWHVKHERGAAGLAAFVAKFRAYCIDDQDGVTSWMRAEFPGMFFIFSVAAAGQPKETATYRGMYLTGDDALTSLAWAKEHILGAGPLGVEVDAALAGEPAADGDRILALEEGLDVRLLARADVQLVGHGVLRNTTGLE